MHWNCSTHWRAVLVVVAGLGFLSPAQAAVVLFEDRVTEVGSVLPDATDLWVKPSVLPAVNGFELKPEGACFEDICVPVRQDEDSAIFVRRENQAWISVTELARRIQQPFVVDHDKGVWSFGAIPVTRQALIREGVAPDFTLPDWRGDEISLSDFKGKKIMLLSWASW